MIDTPITDSATSRTEQASAEQGCGSTLDMAPRAAAGPPLRATRSTLGVAVGDCRNVSKGAATAAASGVIASTRKALSGWIVCCAGRRRHAGPELYRVLYRRSQRCLDITRGVRLS